MPPNKEEEDEAVWEKMKLFLESILTKFCPFCGSDDIHIVKISYGPPLGNPVFCEKCCKIFTVIVPTMPENQLKEE